MKIFDMVKEARPRERFLEYGREALSEAELIAIILRTGTVQENVVTMSNRLISEYGLSQLFSCSIEELQKIKGIGPSKAMQILSIAELGKRYELSRRKKDKITRAKDIYDLFRDRFLGEDREHFLIVLLNSQNRIIRHERVSMGILDASIIHPREIFKPAIKASASRIILVHNHPSGESEPSDEDLVITKRLIEAGQLLGIEVVDHVIIGSDSFWSYAEN